MLGDAQIEHSSVILCCVASNPFVPCSQFTQRLATQHFNLRTLRTAIKKGALPVGHIESENCDQVSNRRHHKQTKKKTTTTTTDMGRSFHYKKHTL